MTNHFTRRAAIAAAPAFALAPAALASSQDDAAAPPLVVILVRHAEKESEGNDPLLTEAGAARAALLATMLRDTGITAVHSTDYNRTKNTAAPAAKSLGVEVSIYDPRDGAAFVKSLREQGGRHLVIGHSNTTTAIVESLGGKPGAPIDEPTEYDRLYIMTVGKAGDVSTVMLRY